MMADFASSVELQRCIIQGLAHLLKENLDTQLIFWTVLFLYLCVYPWLDLQMTFVGCCDDSLKSLCSFAAEMLGSCIMV